MSDSIFSQIEFEKYFHLMADALPGIRGAGACDPMGLMLASSEAWADLPPGDYLDLARFVDCGETNNGKPLSIDCNNEGVSLLRVGVSSRFGEVVGSLVIGLGIDMDCTPETVDDVVADALEAVSACMEREYELTMELDAMARELAGRYEELNLVYVTQDDVSQYDNEWDALNQLVHNCVEYLDVGMVALLFEGKNKTFYATSKREPIPDALAVAHEFYGEFSSWVHSTAQCVVINEFADHQRASLCPRVPYKILACPVLDGAGDSVAVLVCANHNDRADFFNSDRNLLEAMARKASKIIQANYDSLTGLIKARGFEKVIQDLVGSAREKEISHCMLHLDLDQLQVINDNLGRDAGDAVIKWIADVAATKGSYH